MMKTFTGAVISVYLAVGVPVQAHAESVSEATPTETVPYTDPSSAAASWFVQATASKSTIQVHDTIEFHAIFPSAAPAVTEVYGWLSAPGNGDGDIPEERLLHFSYSEEKQVWIAQYTPTPYDTPGKWKLELWGFSDILHKTENAASFVVDNPNPVLDKDAPQMKKYTLSYHNKPLQATDSVKQEGMLAVHVQAADSASGLQGVTAKLQKRQGAAQSAQQAEGNQANAESQQDEQTSSPSEQPAQKSLTYNVQASEWTGAFDMSAVPEGEYDLVLEMKDYAGNIRIEKTGRTVVVAAGDKEKDASDTKEASPVAAAPVKQPSAAPAPAATPVHEAKKVTTAPIPKQIAQAQQTTTKPAPLPSTTSDGKKAKTVSEPTKTATKEAPIQQSKQSPLLYYAAGALLLISVLRSNKEWSE